MNANADAAPKAPLFTSPLSMKLGFDNIDSRYAAIIPRINIGISHKISVPMILKKSIITRN